MKITFHLAGQTGDSFALMSAHKTEQFVVFTGIYRYNCCCRLLVRNLRTGKFRTVEGEGKFSHMQKAYTYK